MIEITFCCDEIDYGNIAEPIPANRFFEDWYKKLPVVDRDHSGVQTGQLKTVKACLPFLDAMTLGYILCVPVDLNIALTSDGFETGWRYPRSNIIEHHVPCQTAGHPRKEPVAKVVTLWSIHTPPGTSCLFFPPLNRAELPFEAISAVIDTDIFHSVINVTSFVTLRSKGMNVITKGTPLVQVIPFHREEFSSVVRAKSEQETRDTSKQIGFIHSEAAAYRKHIRHKTD